MQVHESSTSNVSDMRSDVSVSQDEATQRYKRERLWFSTFFLLSSVVILILIASVSVLGFYARRVFERPEIIVEMFTTETWNPSTKADDFDINPETSDWGMQSMMFGTVFLATIALTFSMIFGFGTAIFLSEYAPKGFSRRAQTFLEFVGSIPSIALAVIALEIFGHEIQRLFDTPSGSTYLAAGLGVAILVTPIIATISYNALRSTPTSQRHAVRAFGATRHEELFAVVLPHARRTMFSSILLAFGRAAGETMVATVVLGVRPNTDIDLLERGSTITSVITNQFGDAPAFGDLRQGLFFTALVLLIFSFIMVGLSQFFASGHPYATKILSFLSLPFVFVKNQLVALLQNFTDEQELTQELVIKQTRSRSLVSKLVAMTFATSLALFVGLVLFVFYSLLVGSWEYFNYTDNIAEVPGRIWRTISTKTSIAGLRERYEIGLLPSIIGSSMIVFVSMFLAFPVATVTGIYLYEFAGNNRYSKVLQNVIINISAIPSIVVGIFVFGAFVVGFNMGRGLLPGAIALGIMMIPIITTNTIEALRNVPQEHKESALALGASRWEAFVKHRFPYAFPSIITGYMLGIARVIGETAPLLFVAVGTSNLLYPTQLTGQPVNVLTNELFVYLTTSTREFRTATGSESVGPLVAEAIALILLLIVSIITITGYFVKRVFQKRYEYNGEL